MGKKVTLPRIRHDRYRPWTVEMDEVLKWLWSQDTSIDEIEYQLGKSERAIKNRIRVMQHESAEGTRNKATMAVATTAN